MTKVQNPIIGRARGSAGGMTFAKNYDKNTMRAKPFEVKNPKTAAQTNQRDFFSQVSDVVKGFTPEQLRTIFPSMPKAMSRRNMLTKQIAENTTTDNGQKVVDFSEILTLGNASTMDFGTTTCSQAGSTITVTLDNAVKNNAEFTNQSFIAVLVNETLGAMVAPSVAAYVATGTMDIAAPEGWLSTHTIHAIPMILSAKDGKVQTVGYGTMSVTKRPARQGRNPRTGQ